MTEWKSIAPYLSSSQSSIAVPPPRRHIFAKFLILCFSKFSSNFAKCKIILSKFGETQNFDKIILNFSKFEENFVKQKIQNFAKISRNYKNENFAATLCRSRVRGGAGRYSPGTSSVLTQIVHYLSSYYTVFHCVIYNSVGFG